MATKYHSTKIVYLLSTIHGHNELNVRNRRTGTIKRPEASSQYNKNMGGVDKQDQIIQLYDCTRKTMKWTKKAVFRFLQVSACNAYILACKNSYDKLFLQFLESVIVAWAFQDQMPPEITESEDIVHLRDRHFPSVIPPNPGKDRLARLCKVCSKRGVKRREVPYYCRSCHSQPALCLPQCYQDFHTRLVYWR